MTEVGERARAHDHNKSERHGRDEGWTSSLAQRAAPL